jgi:hypothetical protein
MGFRRSALQEAFFVPGDFAFRVWGYSTSDFLEEVLRPGYFAASGLVHPGELIYVRMQAQPPARLRGAAPEPVRMALLMVLQATGPDGPTVRLVQDFGSTAEPAAAAAEPALRLTLPATPAAPPKRERGRPAGSRTRKPPASNGHDIGAETDF